MSYEIVKKIELNAPMQKVWRVYRDHLTQIAESMPAVEKITVKSRKEENKLITIENHWEIAGRIPRSIKKIVPKTLFFYKDKAFWDEKTMICSFENEPADGSKIYKCVGKNIFSSTDEGTSLIVDISLTIKSDKLKFIPTILSKTILYKIEKIITRELVRNLEKTAHLVVKYIKQNEL